MAAMQLFPPLHCLHHGLHADQLGREDARRHAAVQVLLKLQQLTHEVEVGRDDGPAGLDELVGVRHGHPGVLHQVGDDDGGRAGHTCLAVDEDALSGMLSFLCTHTHTDKKKHYNN